MNSASEMSKMIRAKKKKMMEDPDAVSLSGIPEDATDLYIKKQNEATEELDENHPAMKSDGSDESPALEMAEEHKEQMSPEDNTMSVELEQMKKLKRERIARTMSKMGR